MSEAGVVKTLRLDDALVGKTIVLAEYESHDRILLGFSDGTSLHVKQTQQAGALDVHYLSNVAYEVIADDKDDDGEELE